MDRMGDRVKGLRDPEGKNRDISCSSVQHLREICGIYQVQICAGFDSVIVKFAGCMKSIRFMMSLIESA